MLRLARAWIVAVTAFALFGISSAHALAERCGMPPVPDAHGCCASTGERLLAATATSCPAMLPEGPEGLDGVAPGPSVPDAPLVAALAALPASASRVPPTEGISIAAHREEAPPGRDVPLSVLNCVFRI